MRKLWMIFVLASLIFCPLYGENIINPAEGLVLANDHVHFEFEPEGRGLSKMIDLKTGYDHIRAVEGKHLLWEVALGVGREIYTITNNYKPCNHAYLEKLPDRSQRAVMQWNDLRWWLENKVVTIQVSVELPADDGVAKWRICVENKSNYWGLWAILFPIVNGFPASGEYDIARPVFASGGQLLKGMADPINARYPGSTWPMQFMSFNCGSNAVYFASMDPEARAKDFVAEPVKNLTSERFPVVFEGRRHKKFVPEPGERIYITHYPDNMGVKGSDYPDYYPVAFGVYQGGWLEAAHRYRPWALAQKWAQKGPLSHRADIPEKIKSIGLWVCDQWEWTGAQGSAQDMNRPFIEAAQKMGVPMGIQWYNWHQNPFDNGYPHFLPAKDRFKERVEQLVRSGLAVMPYINGSSADMNIPDFDMFAPHAVRDEAGGMRLHYYSDQAGRLLSMCGHQVFWQDTIATLVDDIFTQYGVNAIYVDQVSGLYHELCFDKNHGHPLGGGSYWVDGNRELLGKVKSIAHKNGRECLVTSEGSAEVFFDVLDGNLLWSQPSEREIPLMSVVYSGYTLFYGSPCDYKRSDNYFNYAQGQALMDGRQNGWMDFGLFKPEYSRKADYLKQCGQFRVACKKFLTYGRLWGPVQPARTVPTFTEDSMGWGMYEKPRKAVLPATEARLWQSEDGHLAVIMANYVDEEVAFSCSIDPSKYGLPSGRYQLTEITPQGTVSVGKVSGAIERTEMIAPRKIKVIEIAPIQKAASSHRGETAER